MEPEQPRVKKLLEFPPLPTRSLQDPGIVWESPEFRKLRDKGETQQVEVEITGFELMRLRFDKSVYLKANDQRTYQMTVPVGAGDHSNYSHTPIERSSSSQLDKFIIALIRESASRQGQRKIGQAPARENEGISISELPRFEAHNDLSPPIKILLTVPGRDPLPANQSGTSTIIEVYRAELRLDAPPTKPPR